MLYCHALEMLIGLESLDWVIRPEVPQPEARTGWVIGVALLATSQQLGVW